jgi:nucleotide-binding universal stress UspA family protein
VHVLVATDGAIESTAAAEFAARLAGTDGRVTVLSVVGIPRAFLNDMRAAWGVANGGNVVADYTFVETPALGQKVPLNWPGDDALIERYLNDKLKQNTRPVVAELQARGLVPDTLVVESENAAAAIIEQIETLGADAVVIGSHGQGVFEGLLGSTGTKIVRRSPRPVVLIRSATT